MNDRLFNIGIFFSVFFSFFISVFLGVFFFFCLLFFFQRVTFLGFLFPLLIIGTVAFTQYTTIEEGDYDIVRYYTFYDILSQGTFWEAMVFIGLSGDYFFYFIVYILSLIVPDDPRVMSFFFSFTTGLIMLVTYRCFFDYFHKNDAVERYTSPIQLIIWAIGFFCIINFANYTNAYRQFFATALFLWAVSRYFTNKSYLLILLLSLLSHWSILMYLIPFFILRSNLKLMYLVLCGTFFLGLFGVSNILSGISQSNVASYASGEILGVDRTLILVVIVAVFLLSYILYLADRAWKVYLFSLIFMIYALLFLKQSTLMIRLSFAISQFIVILFPLLYLNKQSYIRRRNIHLLMLSVFVCFFSYNVKSILSGNFSYLIFDTFFNSIYSIWCSPFPAEMLL